MNEATRRSERTGVAAIIICFVAASGGLVWYAWSALSDTSISGHGIVAMIIGGILTLGLGIGLMFLIFYSNRRGYDERAHNDDDANPGRDP